MTDGKAIQRKLIGEQDERAVSPVIGVILMVAITVILAAVIAAFVLDLGQSQSASASAGAQFDKAAAPSGVVEVSLISKDRIDDGTSLTVNCEGNATNPTLTDVGETVSCDHDDETVTIVGTYQGEESTVQTWNP
ncbi:type IV pilin [Natrinema caseinilyticum]|uniref:type IV pilin n=1 Tax=Natrinema caseinilyticum TaxID=2961570 RepID=UPI0020C38FC1|nr:type IV pilin N-terminal domain-containing protein [Natrinema caseinilyticum]